MSKINFILILAALWLAGCGSKQATPTYEAPVIEGDWTVSMKQSGGIMGLLRFIAVDSQGNYKAIDQRTGNTVTGELTQTELSQLEEMVTTLTITSPKNPAVCADCFVYEIEIESNGKKLIAQSDDISLPDTGMQTLVEFLRNKLDVVLR